MKFLTYLIIFGVCGLAVGYFLFGRFNGHYIPVNDLFFSDKGFMNAIGDAITGAERIRKNVLISGAIGGVVGILFAAISGNSRRRR